MRIGFRISLAVVLAGALAAFSAEAQTSFSGVWTSRPLARTLAGEAGPRGWVDLIHDPVVGRPVLFGGSGGLYMNDILQIDLPGSRWIEIEPHTPNANVTPDGPPCGRDEHAVEFDSFNRLYWSFGGSGYACNTRTSVVGAGSGPTQIVDPSLTQTTVDFYENWLVTIFSTTPFYSYVSAYDPTTKTLTLRSAFPGDPTGVTYSVRAQGGGGTWFYNPATREWRGFEAPSFGYVGARPMSRLSPAFAYSTRDAAAVMFGGIIYNDTWALDVETRTWVAMRGNGWAGNPPRRAQVTNSMVYDSVNDVFVLFGGQCSNGSGCGGVPYNGLLGDTWIYRLATNTWTQMTPGTSPPARMQQTLSYDPASGVVVLFGGLAASGTQNDVWVYDVPSSTWTQVSTGSAPATRRLHAMIYDPNAGEHIIYGGAGASGATLGDVWSLRLTRTGSGNPVPVLTSLSPTSALQGGAAFTLSVSGGGLVAPSVVRLNGADRPTTYVSSTQLQATIPASDLAAEGTAAVTVFNPAPGGGVSNALSFTIAAPPTPGEIILDNAPVGVQDAAGGRTFTGVWCTSSATSFYGTDSLFGCGSGTDLYRWTPALPAGTYDVYVWWTTHPNRSTSVPITVVHAAGSTSRTFNQQTGGGQWILHGRYTLNAGTGGHVEVSDASGQAAADAVRFTPAPGAALPTVTMMATTATASEAGQTPGIFTVTRTGSTEAALTVVYTVSGTATPGGDYAALTGSVTIAAGAGSVTIAVTPVDDTLVEGDETVVVTLSPDPAYAVGTPGTASVTITSDDVTSGPTILDNGANGTSSTGAWCASAATDFFGSGSLYSCGGGLDTYRWTPTLAAGIYDVYVWWTTHPNRSTGVPITVVHAGGATTRTFNQQTGGGQWVPHGRYTFNAGTGGYVQVSDVNGQAAADAARFTGVP